MAASCLIAENAVSFALAGLTCAYHAKLFPGSDFCWPFCILDLYGLLQPDSVIERLCVEIGHSQMQHASAAAFATLSAISLPCTAAIKSLLTVSADFCQQCFSRNLGVNAVCNASGSEASQ